MISVAAKSAIIRYSHTRNMTFKYVLTDLLKTQSVVRIVLQDSLKVSLAPLHSEGRKEGKRGVKSVFSSAAQ